MYGVMVFWTHRSRAEIHWCTIYGYKSALGMKPLHGYKFTMNVYLVGSYRVRSI